MTATKKDYELIARVIANALAQNERIDREDTGNPSHGGAVVVEELANDMADALAEQNPKFDRARFLRACEVQS